MKAGQTNLEVGTRVRLQNICDEELNDLLDAVSRELDAADF